MSFYAAPTGLLGYVMLFRYGSRHILMYVAPLGLIVCSAIDYFRKKVLSIDDFYVKFGLQTDDFYDFPLF